MSTVPLHLPLDHVPVIGTLLGVCLPAYAALRTDEGWPARAPECSRSWPWRPWRPSSRASRPRVRSRGWPVSGSVERHEEAAILSTIALGVLGALSLGALPRFRRRRLPRMAAVAFLLAGLIPAGAMAWTANLGGQVRHTEIRPGAAAPGESPAAGPEVVEQSDDDRSG